MAFGWPAAFIASLDGDLASEDSSHFWLFECEDNSDRDSGSDDDQPDSEDNYDFITFSSDAYCFAACCSIAQCNLKRCAFGQLYILYQNLRL